VSPGVHDDDEKNQESKDDEDDGNRFGIPKLAKTSGNLIEIHLLNLHQPGAKPKRPASRISRKRPGPAT
jgi:hypothetical protein